MTVLAPAIPQPVRRSYPNPRLNYLDTVRGLAAMTVLAFHYCQAYAFPPGGRLWTRTPASALCDGFAAVSMFFVLSGLVLSLRFFRDSTEPDLSELHLVRFAANRLCRIWLPFVAFTVASSLLPRGHFAREATSPAPTQWLHFYWTNPRWPLSLHQIVRDCLIFRTEHPMLVPQGWTLSVEMALSLLVPIGVLIAGRGTTWLVVTVGLAVVSLHTTPFIFHFALGILLAKYCVTWQGKHRLLGGAARWAILAAGIFLYTARATIPFDWGFDDRQPVIWWLSGTGSALILLFIISSPAAQRFLSVRPLAHLGRISYSVYLAHMAVLFCLAPLVMAHLPDTWYWRNWALGLLAVAAVTIAVAELSYRVIEKPTIRLGRWVSGRSFQPWRGGAKEIVAR